MSWPMVPFGEILKLAPRELAKNQRLPIMSITMKDGLIDQDEKFKKRIASADTSTYKVVHRGNLVVGFPIDEGVLGFQHKYAAAAVSPAYDIWEATGQHDLDRDFFEKILRSPMARAIYASKMRGTTNRRRTIPKDIFKKILFPLPPLPEQKRIAAILDAADALRAKRRESLEQLDQLLQSTFLEMFGDPVTNPKGWETDRLDEACDKVIDCPHSTPKWTESGVICLRTSNLKYGEWDWTDTRYVSEESFSDRTRRSEIEPEDIILSREGTVGVLALVNKGMRICMGQRLVQLRVNNTLIKPKYLLHLLLHDLAPERLSRLMAGSTSKHLNVKELRKMPVMLPPLDLQQHFATIVESIEQQKARYRTQLDELDTLFASLTEVPRVSQGSMVTAPRDPWANR